MPEAPSEIIPLKRIVSAGIAAGIFLSLLIVGSFYGLNVSIKAEDTSAAQINISGRQRMLTQQIAHLSQQLVISPDKRTQYRKQLLAALDLMEKSHRALIKGDPAMGLYDQPSSDLRAMYFEAPLQVDRQVQEFLKAGRALAAAGDAALSNDNPDLQAIRTAADGPLQAALDAVVYQYQRENEAGDKNTQRLGIGIMLLILAVMLFMVLFIFRPIVQRIRETTSSLVASETINRTIVDTMADGLITINEQGIVQSFNPAAEHIFGYLADEVIGKNVNILMPQPYHSQHDGYIRNYLNTGKAKVIGIGRIVEAKRKDASTFPLELAISEMSIDGKRHFAGLVRDISERKATEAEIEAKNRELELRSRYDRSYSQVMSLFSSTYDREKVLSGTLSILANNHPIPVSAIYELDEWQGLLVCSATYGTPETLKKSFELGQGLVGQAAREGEVLVLNPGDDDNGMNIEAGIINFRPTAIIASPICYQAKALGVLVLALSKPLIDPDIPFIEHLSGQLGVALNNLRQYSNLKDLSHRLKVRSEEISQKNLQLREANRMKSEFLANMSHELRTPLNAIIGFSEVLKDGVLGEMTDEQTEYVTDIFNSGRHLLSLINDILDLSKIEAGKMELSLRKINVPGLLQNSLAIIKEKAMARHIKLDLEIDKDVDTCWLDGRKTKQMIYNLLSNAVKFTPDGGKVTIRARRSPVPPSQIEMTSEESDFLEITVTDTGIGISKEDQERLFQPFTQVDSSLSRKYEGTGLGLVMTKKLAELHGGMVSVESMPDKGSTFTIWLPYRTETGKAARPALQQVVGEKSSVESPRVLIIEDEDAAADLMRVQLETDGYRTFRAATAEEALEMMGHSKPDLITLDILLPGMDGWDFLAEIKKNTDYAGIPVVIVSIVADENRGFSLGASQVLEKPVRKKQLLKALAETGIVHSKQGTPSRILVVDDDPKVVEVVARYLESKQYTVLRAYSGAEGIETAIREHPDLIVLDLMMPEVTGFDVVHALKKKKETKTIPIIILTAKVITEDDRRELNSGVMKIVQKSNLENGAFMAEVHRAVGVKPSVEQEEK